VPAEQTGASTTLERRAFDLASVGSAREAACEADGVSRACHGAASARSVCGCGYPRLYKLHESFLI
jgi:hypothetical protein